MPAPPDPRTEVVRSAVRAIAAVRGRPAHPVIISVSCGGTRIEETVSPEEAAELLGPPAVEGLSVLAAALREQLADEPRTAKALARAAGYSMGSHVYAALRELEGRGLLVKSTKGYRLRA